MLRTGKEVGEEEEEEEEWAHVECCRWLGLVDGKTGFIPPLVSRLKALRRMYMQKGKEEEEADGKKKKGKQEEEEEEEEETVAEYKCQVYACPEPHRGGLLPCSQKGCGQFFHVSCGRRNNQEMYVLPSTHPPTHPSSPPDHSNRLLSFIHPTTHPPTHLPTSRYHGTRFGPNAWVAYCEKHTQPLRFADTVRMVRPTPPPPHPPKPPSSH